MYNLTTGTPVTSLAKFTSPLDEYRAAFDDPSQPFIHYYTFDDKGVSRHSMTRGEFWRKACCAAACLDGHGLSKGDRVVHCFSRSSPDDLAFRLAAALMGCTPVTVNWQADDDERIVYKATRTDAKLLIHDLGFADRVARLGPDLADVPTYEASLIDQLRPLGNVSSPPLTYDDERIIIFTSGTTGLPKAAALSHRSYLTNRLTYESYFGISEDVRLDLLLVNPLHHANSTALSDWALRRKGAVLHLLERYSTPYWKILVNVIREKRDLLITSLVARHFEFLETLASDGKLPAEEDEIRDALAQTDILIGSAPVGPTTVERVLKFAGRVPHVRFGSTETCLQVIAIPNGTPTEEAMRAFRAGWSHRHGGKEATGYYMGREHYPFTRVQVVRSIEPGSAGYLEPCDPGEPGYFVTQGGNLMTGYVSDPEATEAVFREGWYTGLRDIVFALEGADGNLNYYWMSRDSELLIRGGANYSYAQIHTELSRFVAERFGLGPEACQLAVVGLRLESEHDDSCCVTIELSENAGAAGEDLQANFLEAARASVSKAARPDRVRFAKIPRSFKEVVLYPQLRQEFLDSLNAE